MKRKISGTSTARQISLMLLISILSISCTTDEIVIVARDAASVGS